MRDQNYVIESCDLIGRHEGSEIRKGTPLIFDLDVDDVMTWRVSVPGEKSHGRMLRHLSMLGLDGQPEDKFAWIGVPS